jgi:hypothetical protein
VLQPTVHVFDDHFEVEAEAPLHQPPDMLHVLAERV